MPQQHFTQIERRSIDYVPLAERHGSAWHLAPIWFSGNAQLATVATGAVGMLLGGSLFWTAIAALLGCALGTFFMAFHSAQGPQLGLPQMIQSRPQFGYVGAVLVWGVALVVYVGFNSFNQILAAQAVQSVYGGDTAVIVIAFTILSIAVAIVGHDLIHLAQRWIACVMIVALMIISVALVRLNPSAWQPALDDFRAVPFLAQLFAAAGYLLSWSIYVSDYSRYLPNTVEARSSFWWTYLGCFFGGAWMMLVGTLAAALFPHLDVATGLRRMADSLIPGFGSPLLLISLLGLLTITSLNLYGSALTLLSVADSLRPGRLTVGRRAVAMLCSAMLSTGFALMASRNFMREFGSFLDVLVYLLTPWTAINLIDFYAVRKGHYSVREIFNPRGMYGRWNWRGLSAYGVGFVAMIPFFSTGFYTGRVAEALGGADISMMVGLPIAAMTYLWACRSIDLRQDRARAYDADIGLDADEVECCEKALTEYAMRWR